MGRNVEIKARIRNLHAIEERVRALSPAPTAVLHQEDIFFRTRDGRFKLRAFSPSEGELIHYERENDTGPRLSRYVTSPTADPSGLQEVLARACGILGVVRKTRILYIVGRTRIHLDRVEGLGDFIELEVMLSEEESIDDGVIVATELMDRLGITKEDLIDRAYIDLLREESGGPATA